MKQFSLLFALLIAFTASPITSAEKKKKKRTTLNSFFGPSVIEDSDKFEGTTTYKMDGNKVFSKLSGMNALGNLLLDNDAPTFDTFLELEKHVLKDGTVELAILFQVKAENNATVDIMEGESLIFLLDNNGRLDLSTEGAFNLDYGVDGTTVTSEAHARYMITKQQLEEINSSEKVEFRIILKSFQSGTAQERDKDQQHLDGEFSKKNKKVWNEFYDLYVAENQQ